jgi:hypothetical protein
VQIVITRDSLAVESSGCLRHTNHTPHTSQSQQADSKGRARVAPTYQLLTLVQTRHNILRILDIHLNICALSSTLYRSETAEAFYRLDILPAPVTPPITSARSPAQPEWSTRLLHSQTVPSSRSSIRGRPHQPCMCARVEELSNSC